MKAPFQDGLFRSRRNSKFAERLERIGSGSALGDGGPRLNGSGGSTNAPHVANRQGPAEFSESARLRENAERLLAAARKQPIEKQAGTIEARKRQSEPQQALPQQAPSRPDPNRPVARGSSIAPGPAVAAQPTQVVRQPARAAAPVPRSAAAAQPVARANIPAENGAARQVPTQSAQSRRICDAQIQVKPGAEAGTKPGKGPSAQSETRQPVAVRQPRDQGTAANIAGQSGTAARGSQNMAATQQPGPGAGKPDVPRQPAGQVNHAVSQAPAPEARTTGVGERTGQEVVERPATPVAKAAPLSKAVSSVQSLRRNLPAASSVMGGAPSDADHLLEEAPIESVMAVCRSALWPVGLFSLVINILMLTGPLFMLQVYDRALPSGSVPTLVLLFLLVSVLYVFFALLEGIRGRVFIRLGTRIDEILHRPLYRSTLDISALNSPAVGTNPLRDLDGIRTYVSGPGPAAFFDVPWVPVYIGLVFILHPLLGFFAAFAAILLVVVAITNKKSTHQGHLEAAQAAEGAQRFADDGRQQAAAAQALGMSETLIHQWAALKAESRRLISTVSDRAGLLSSMSKSIRLYFQSAMLGLGAWLAIEQAISAGMIIAGTIIMSRALAPIEQIVQQWSLFVGAQRSWGRIKLLFEKIPVKKPRSTTLPMPSGAVQVAGLACFVEGGRTPVISGINFQLEPGAGLGIIGPSGAGKSTLIKALLGIWPTFRGDVRLDGATHDQWDRDVLGRHFGYLPQGAMLLPGTIAQNIARFENNPPSDAVLAAAQVTGAHRLAVSFENGYDTLVGPGGVQLSAGQVQRIALARAVYKLPAIVVLDEPYSNLDADGEQALTESIKTLREHGSTVIVVAHRASALNALDTVLCLKDGTQAFYGPKDEVLRAMTRAVAGDNGQQRQVTPNKGQVPMVQRVK